MSRSKYAIRHLIKVQIFFFLIFLCSCTTPKNIQGQSFFAEIVPLAGSHHYQGGTTSLPAARIFTQTRAQAMQDAANRESQARSAATATTFGTALSALGLSLNGAGSQELFSILGLTNAASLGGTQLYTNRLRQELLDEGARTMNCLVSTTDPYFIRSKKFSRLFGAADNDSKDYSEQAQLLGMMERQGMSANDMASVLTLMKPTMNSFAGNGLQSQLREVIRKVHGVRPVAIEARKLLSGETDDDKVELAEFEAALLQATASLSEADIIAGKLAQYRGGVDSAGSALSGRVRDVILYMSKEMRRLEPDPARAATVFAAIKSGLPGTLESFNAGNLSATLGELAGVAPVDKTSSGRRDALNNLNNAIAALQNIIDQTKDELAIIDVAKQAAGTSENCKDPSTADTLIVSPPGANLTLGPGDDVEIKILIGGGGGAPSATEIADSENVLTVGKATPVAGATGEYTVKVSAKDKVEKAASASVLFASDKTTRAERKTFLVTASKAPTVALAPSGRTELVVGKSTPLKVTVSDGSAPTIAHEDSIKSTFLTFGTPTKKSDTEYEILLSGVKETKSPITLVISAGTPTAKQKLIVTAVKEAPAAANGTPQTAPQPTDSEKVAAFVKTVQTYLNDNHLAAGASKINVNGEMNAETMALLMVFQKKEGLSESGRIDEKTFAKLLDRIVEKNQSAAQSAWNNNKEDAKKALAVLKNMATDWGKVINNDDAFSNSEQKKVLLYQIGMHRADPAANSNLPINGVLDENTIKKILGVSQ